MCIWCCCSSNFLVENEHVSVYGVETNSIVTKTEHHRSNTRHEHSLVHRDRVTLTSWSGVSPCDLHRPCFRYGCDPSHRERSRHPIDRFELNTIFFKPASMTRLLVWRICSVYVPVFGRKARLSIRIIVMLRWSKL